MNSLNKTKYKTKLDIFISTTTIEERCKDAQYII